MNRDRGRVRRRARAPIAGWKRLRDSIELTRKSVAQPGERLRRRKSEESGETYPSAIWLGPSVRQLGLGEFAQPALLLMLREERELAEAERLLPVRQCNRSALMGMLARQTVVGGFEIYRINCHGKMAALWST
jgi:hypothetical protein